MKHVLRRQATLAGVVVDAATGAPLAGARVQLSAVPAAMQRKLDLLKAGHGAAWERLANRPDRATADAAGRYVFLDLPSGAYAIDASYPAGGRRYGPGKGKATVKRNKTGDVTTAWVDLALPATTVAGKVTGQGAKPVPLASVQVKGGTERAYTDSRGQYRLAGLEPGARTLVVTARDFRPAEQAVVLADPGVSKTVNVALTSTSS